MMNREEYQRCSKCVMDTSDTKISFDENGVCDHCRNFEKKIKPFWKPQENRFEELEQISKVIRKAGKGKEYDCILGLSGGVDSSYLAYIAKEVMHLRPLIYVVDTGWNLNVAVENIEKIVKGLKLDMYTDVVNWKEMADLQLSYFKAQVPFQDAPQDHAIFASLYNYAVKHHIKYVLTGSNRSTEFVRPPLEYMPLNDLRLLKDIHKKYGTKELRTFPLCGIFKYRLLYRYLYGMKRVFPLDYVIYDKENAEKLLHDRFGWTRYENKHYENVFTRFYEGYYLVNKFGYDTRKNVLSSQILAGMISRDEALSILSNNTYEPEQIEQDKEYIAKKLGINKEEFENIISGENKTWMDYKNVMKLILFGAKVCRFFGIESRNLR